MKDYDTTLARMAGNIAGGLLSQFEVRGSEVAVVPSQLQAIAKVSVELARRIVEILRHEGKLDVLLEGRAAVEYDLYDEPTLRALLGQVLAATSRYKAALEDILTADETSTLAGAIAIARHALETHNE